MKLDFKLKEDMEKLVERALEEDIGDGDLTTELVLKEEQFTQSSIIAKEEGILAGVEMAEISFIKVDETLQVETLLEDGDTFNRDSTIMKISGNGSSMLKAERVALNFLGRLSGIASLTAEFVSKVEGTEAVILDTRKTTPTLRNIEKYAVRAGGGTNHRMGLYDQILVKENHAAWAGGLGKAVKNVIRSVGKERDFIKIIVEARSKADVEEAMIMGVDRILLDNMSPDEVKNIRNDLPKKWTIEVSGGINLDNVREYADVGAGYISVGMLTHSVKSSDFTMLMETK